MLTAVVILKALIAVAGLSLLGQGVLYLLAGAEREKNIFYRILKTISAPVVKTVRFITPRVLVTDAYIGMAAFFLLAGVYLALILQQRELCLKDLRQPWCQPLAVEYAQRCQAGQTQACEALQRGAGSPPATPPADAPGPRR
jgi:hypothetical protein